MCTRCKLTKISCFPCEKISTQDLCAGKLLSLKYQKANLYIWIWACFRHNFSVLMNLQELLYWLEMFARVSESLQSHKDFNIITKSRYLWLLDFDRRFLNWALDNDSLFLWLLKVVLHFASNQHCLTNLSLFLREFLLD